MQHVFHSKQFSLHFKLIFCQLSQMNWSMDSVTCNSSCLSLSCWFSRVILVINPGMDIFMLCLSSRSSLRLSLSLTPYMWRQYHIHEHKPCPIQGLQYRLCAWAIVLNTIIIDSKHTYTHLCAFSFVNRNEGIVFFFSNIDSQPAHKAPQTSYMVQRTLVKLHMAYSTTYRT